MELEIQIFVDDHIFAVHPIHIEAVANTTGRAEIGLGVCSIRGRFVAAIETVAFVVVGRRIQGHEWENILLDEERRGNGVDDGLYPRIDAL